MNVGDVSARRQQLGEEAIGFAPAIIDRGAGAIGRVAEGHVRGRGDRQRRGGDRKSKFASRTLILALKDLHVTRKTAMIAQQLAALPEPTRRAIVSRAASARCLAWLEQAHEGADPAGPNQRAWITTIRKGPEVRRGVAGLRRLFASAWLRRLKSTSRGPRMRRRRWNSSSPNSESSRAPANLTTLL
jgi:hypothetical protein